MFNALSKRFKMANNREMIDANQRSSFVYSPIHNYELLY